MLAFIGGTLLFMNYLRSLFTFIGLMAIFAFGQSNQKKIHLKSGNYHLSQTVENFISNPGTIPNEIVGSQYYRIIQFKETPTPEEKELLQNNGIQLLHYLPDFAFYASIQKDANLASLLQCNAIFVDRIQTKYKLTDDLIQENYPQWTLLPQNRIGLNAIYFKTQSDHQINEDLLNLEATILSRMDNEHLILSIPLNNLADLYQLPYFYYFETLDAPEKPEDDGDVANHRTNYLQNIQGAGIGFDGTGVTVAIHDDGPIGPHIDYQGRITTITTTDYGDHGDHCSGILMGAGNLDPDGIGNAPGAELFVFGSANTNYNVVPLLIDTANLVITSKSYGNGENAGYTSLARTLDEQCYENPALIHVFSAGNSGADNFGWGAGAGWANITGGHKQGKNVLAVGNVGDNDVLNGSSSRGPADDGRIKPDICAVGTGVISTIDPNDYGSKTGTSMACPGVAGSLATLYEAYRFLNNNENPDAALMNAAILNTAEDLGNPGPDFKYGWGRINLQRAYRVISERTYQEGIIAQGEINQHQIEIPANTKQVRIMVYWTDYPGSPSASKALVNDLNMSATGPDGANYQPLVLNPTPIPSLLDQDAVPGIDDLNNVEQITIDTPIPGNYTLYINGFNVPQGPQKYFIVYQPIIEDLIVTFPIGGEGVNNGEAETIRWDALGEDELFRLDYSVDGGITWEEITPGLPGSWRSYPWNVPADVITGEAQVRVSRGSDIATSKNFSIIDQPINLEFLWACPNSFNFAWSPVPGAIGYEVYLLGEKYMDYQGYVTDTNAAVYANSMESQWVSVVAVGENGARSKRAVAINKSPGIFDCNLSDPIVQFTASCNLTGPGTCVQFTDESLNAGQGAAWEWYFPGGSPETSNDESPLVCYPELGNYDVYLKVLNGVGEDETTYTNFVQITPAQSLPFGENFESGNINEDWFFENDNGSTQWTLANNVSAYKIGSKSLFFENNVPTRGRFTTQQINLIEENVAYELNFDVAYGGNDAGIDSLIVYITYDCGNTLYPIYQVGGTSLQTTSEINSVNFNPTSDEWRNEHVIIEGFEDKAAISFVFEAYSENGSPIYVDNLNIRVSESNFPESNIAIFPNPFTDLINIAGLAEGETTTIRIHDASGKLIVESTFIAPGGTIALNNLNLGSGVYVIQIESDTINHQEKLIKGRF